MNMQKITQMITDYREEKERIRKILKEGGQEYIESLTKDFMVKYEDFIESIFWTQYTPYFNDGDPCEFGKNEIYTLLKTDDEDDEDEDRYYEGDEIYSLDDVEIRKEYVRKSQTPDYWAEKVKQIEEIILSYPDGFLEEYTELKSNLEAIDDEMAEMIFGDHVKIIITKNGVEVEEYDHD